jgi:hypothetical protein
MHMPSVVGRDIEFRDKEAGVPHILAAVDFDMELAFQTRMEADARARLPRPGDPDRREMLEIHQDKVNANEFAFNGPTFRRLLCTFAGQAAYLHFLMACGYQKRAGKAAPALPARELEGRLRAETEALALAERDGATVPAVPLTELWLEVLDRDFPTARRAASSPPATTAATTVPSTPG